MRQFVFYSLLFFSLSVFSQKKKLNAPFSIRGNVGIPSATSSQMFRTAFGGVYEFNLSANARIFSNFFAGLGYQNSHFVNKKGLFDHYVFKDPSSDPPGKTVPYTTQLNGQGGFIKLGYDHFFDKGYVSFCLNSGVMACAYQHVNKDTSLANRPYGALKFNAPYFQPEIAVNFMTDGNLSFSIMLSYATMLYHFDPKAPRFNHIEEVNSTSNSYVMSWINIGFGFNILLGKK
ncbi:MAG: hypothetical protein PSX36_02305 [bacterium]|nr:hypothetical protein [bacterium]